MQVRDDVILGLDIGVGSLGWALLEEDLQTGEQRLLDAEKSRCKAGRLICGSMHKKPPNMLFSIPL